MSTDDLTTRPTDEPDRPTLTRRRLSRLAGGGLAGAALLLGAPAPGRASEPARAPAPADAGGPNRYELDRSELRVIYSTSSFSGEPQLDLIDPNGVRTFTGDLIGVEATGLGTLVTVMLAEIADAETKLFSLLSPAVGEVAVAPEIGALGIYTAVRTSIAGPVGVDGPIQRYRVVELTGTARVGTF